MSVSSATMEAAISIYSNGLTSTEVEARQQCLVQLAVVVHLALKTSSPRRTEAIKQTEFSKNPRETSLSLLSSALGKNDAETVLKLQFNHLFSKLTKSL